MDLLKIILGQIPILLGALALLIVAITQLGKDKGAPVILAGAIGIFLMVVINPVVTGVLVPRIMESGNPQNLGSLMRVWGFVSSSVWGVSLVLISIGIVMRSRDGRSGAAE